MNNKHHPGNSPLWEPLAVLLIACLHTLSISIGNILSLAGTLLRLAGLLFLFSIYLEWCGAVSVFNSVQQHYSSVYRAGRGRERVANWSVLSNTMVAFIVLFGFLNLPHVWLRSHYWSSVRIDDKESGQNHDLIFLHLHMTGFNNTVYFLVWSRLERHRARKHACYANLSPHSLHLQGYFTSGDLSVSLFIWGTLMQYMDLSSKKHAASCGLLKRKPSRWRGTIDFSLRASCVCCYQEIRTAKLSVGNCSEEVQSIAMKSFEG